jgi:hypothetical protein
VTDDRPPLRPEQGTTLYRHPPSCPTRQQEGYEDVSRNSPLRQGRLPPWSPLLCGKGLRRRDQGKKDHANNQREEDFRQVHHPRSRWILPLREASYGVVEELKGQEGQEAHQEEGTSDSPIGGFLS